ncbi:MAG: carbon-nitrogen hydrolase family protein [Archangiaceae bacterium]|nr:carbon-nitrogen hydrolase family protein [Archangiaceae bacterium]
MRVTVLELPARFGAVDAAFREVELLLATAPPGDLVLLPEAALTGYLPDPSGLAEKADGPTAQRLQTLAKKHHTVVVGPLIEREKGHVYNAAVAPGLFHYRKQHPWYVEQWATAGTAPMPSVRIAGLRVTLCICFDIHFLPKLDADVLLFPSAWVDDEGDARATLLPEVARTHQVAVVNANWGLGRPRVNGQGGSMVVSREGEILARLDGGARRLDVDLPGPR